MTNIMKFYDSRWSGDKEKSLEGVCNPKFQVEYFGIDFQGRHSEPNILSKTQTVNSMAK
jgi:hypothetical protein